VAAARLPDSADGGLAVRTISLDHEIDCGALPEPDNIKIDAEGKVR
jgi:hypothetical protein